jgi:choline dehydrogenase-like flavoprotein
LFFDTHELADGKVLEAELCIIGAGAAGIALALGLLERGMDVLLLEAGGFGFESASQELYEGEVADERLHSPPIRYRQRRYGGSTTIWGGRCMPFDPIDFEPRAYVPQSGWPLDFASIASFYPRANELCEAGRYAYRASDAFSHATREMLVGFDPPHFSTDTLERFSCPTDFGRRYATKLRNATNVRVLLHASVTHLQLDATGRRIIAARVRNQRNGRFVVRARQFVLATGGLEVPRLLLASRDVHPAGIGNAHDVVGRYYMCHLAGNIGQIRIPGPPSNVWHGYDISDEGVYCRRRLALKPEQQRAIGLGNFVARLHHPRITDPAHRSAVLSLLVLAKSLIPYEYGKRLHGEQAMRPIDWLRHARNALLRPQEAAAFAWHMLRDRKLAERKFPSIVIASKANLYSLEFHCEQQPNPSSRISLSERVDAFGMPRIRVDWRYTAADVRTVARSLELLREDFAHSHAGTFDYDASTVEAEMIRYGAYGGHHIGTARMGSDPRTSVVDRDCRVHGVANLYVAGSAVFPTSSQANPTLTIVALALRLAEHLTRVRQTAVTEPIHGTAVTSG